MDSICGFRDGISIVLRYDEGRPHAQSNQWSFVMTKGEKAVGCGGFFSGEPRDLYRFLARSAGRVGAWLEMVLRGPKMGQMMDSTFF